MITYLQGDATRPQPSDSRIIMHICNDRGGWGAGFVLALSKRWKDPEGQYRKWYREGKHQLFGDFALGNVGWCLVEPDIWVANMIAQTGYGRSRKLQHRSDDDPESPPIRYDALLTCLAKVAASAKSKGSTVHAPRIGTGLAMGDWRIIEPMIEEAFRNLEVYIYEYGC